MGNIVKCLVATSLVGLQFEEKTYIDKRAFDKLTLTQQGTFLSENGSYPYVFLDSFDRIKSKSIVLTRLKNQEDVSLELAYHDIEIPEGFREIQLSYFKEVENIKNLLIGEKTSGYPESEFSEGQLFCVSADKLSITYGKYKINNLGEIDHLKEIFQKATKYWAKYHTKLAGERTPCKPDMTYYYLARERRTPEVNKDFIRFGCQTVTRYAAEQLGRDMGWEFPS